MGCGPSHNSVLKGGGAASMAERIRVLVEHENSILGTPAPVSVYCGKDGIIYVYSEIGGEFVVKYEPDQMHNQSVRALKQKAAAHGKAGKRL